jgi:transcriptional regulator with XRE-family HTH domain
MDFNLGVKLKWLRKRFDYSQEEIAKKLSIPRPSVSAIECGQREVSAYELLILSDIFGVEMRDLMVQDLKGIKARFVEMVDPEEYKHYLSDNH